MASDLENVDMGSEDWEGDGEVGDGEETKENKINVRNLFGSIVDFITNKNQVDHEVEPDSDSTSKSRPSNASDHTEARRRTMTLHPRSQNVPNENAKVNLERKKTKDVAESDFKSKVLGFFTNANNDVPKEPINDADTPNAQINEEWEYRSKEDRLYKVSEETRQECIKLLRYYKSGPPSKLSQKIDQYLPVYLELDSPIPEELALDYEYAKYDISGLMPDSDEITPEYKETLIKYETLAWFWSKKAEMIRTTNFRLAEKIEINLFPLILENSIAITNKVPKVEEFMISVKGKKRKKFWQHSLINYLKLYKEQLLLGWLRGENWEFVIPFFFDDPKT